MKATDRKQNLLSNIQLLHKRIGDVLIRKRLQTYHIQDNSANHINLLNTLSNYLDKLHASYTVNQQSTELRSTYITANTPPENPVTPGQSAINTPPTLAHYFKASGNSPPLHPHISDKLKACIMENFHASIRHARQGNRDNAELHIAIARQALLELGCFLSADECNAFIKELQETINCCASYFDINFRTELAANRH
jgi:hypothetical protein